MPQSKKEKIWNRIQFIIEVLERNAETNVYHNYMKVLKPGGQVLPEPQHNFGFITKDGSFYGGGILESRIYDNDVLKRLANDFDQVISSENLIV